MAAEANNSRNSESAGPTRQDEVWEVVCLECFTIQRNGHWTIERATTLAGHSTGYCPDCFARLRRSDRRGR